VKSSERRPFSGQNVDRRAILKLVIGRKLKECEAVKLIL
jgi:hypothetical protein